MSISPDDLLAALRWRYATKKFDPARKIPEVTWDAIEETLILTPSSFGLQPWKFLVVADPGMRANLAGESWRQPQVTEASHFVVLTARTNLDTTDIDEWMARMGEVQGTGPETLAMIKGMIEGFAQPMSHEMKHEWNIRQTYIALGQLMTAAAVMGIDSCPMEGFSPAGYDRLLGIEGSGYATVVACALGYRSDDCRGAATPKARFGRSRVIERI